MIDGISQTDRVAAEVNALHIINHPKPLVDRLADERNERAEELGKLHQNVVERRISSYLVFTHPSSPKAPPRRTNVPVGEIIQETIQHGRRRDHVVGVHPVRHSPYR